MIAEGGTEYGHMETIARSDNPFGPFEPCPRNPILTHRNRGSQVIQGTGHADLVEDHQGNWWAVFLAFRCTQEYQQYHHLGRETFLAPVVWDEEGWPVINGSGTVEATMTAPDLPARVWDPAPVRDDFDQPSLNFHWNFFGPLPAERWSLSERSGWLRLKGTTATLDDAGMVAFAGRRQQHFTCKASTLVELVCGEARHEAGLTVYMDHKHHYEIALSCEDGVYQVLLRKRIGDLSAVMARRPVESNQIILQVQAYPTHYEFAYAVDNHAPISLGTGESRYLSSEVAGGFTGVYLGLYATCNQNDQEAVADFDWFDYEPT